MRTLWEGSRETLHCTLVKIRSVEKVFNIPQISQKCIKTMENLTVLAVARGGYWGGGGGSRGGSSLKCERIIFLGVA